MIYLNEKKIAVIGIDHGYGNIKTANTITPMMYAQNALTFQRVQNRT